MRLQVKHKQLGENRTMLLVLLSDAVCLISILSNDVLGTTITSNHLV